MNLGFVCQHEAEEGGPWLSILSVAEGRHVELLELMNYPSKLKDWEGGRNVNISSSSATGKITMQRADL